MSVYIVTGKLGSGKTLACVGRIRDYLRRGRRVVSNLDLSLEHLLPVMSRHNALRLPDKPRRCDLDAIGSGYDLAEGYHEDRFGLLVLDELGSWLNSRSWSDRERAAVIDWFLHARKHGWDVLLIVQDVSIIDKQLRDSLCEHLVICRRLDRIPVPVIGRLLGSTLPRIHVASVYYGDSTSSLRVDRWWYRGDDLYAGYSTGQVFTDDYMPLDGGLVDMRAPYTQLSAWHLVGRYRARLRWSTRLLRLLLSGIPRRIRDTVLRYLLAVRILRRTAGRKV